MHVNSDFGKISRAKLVIVDGLVVQDRVCEAGREATAEDYEKADLIQFKGVVIKDIVRGIWG